MNFQTITTAWRTANDFGLGWTVRRLVYELKLRTGHHKRRLPKRSWRKNELSHWLKDGSDGSQLLASWRAKPPKFFFDFSQQEAIASAMRSLSPDIEVEANIHQVRYFSKLVYDVKLPEVWFTNPFLEPPLKITPDLHWSEYPMYSPEYEDLKFVWEYGRFAVVYDLVRRYALTGEEALAEQYWTLIESWIAHNPPNTGPHWKCGQEISLRLMAWYFGLFAFLDSPTTTPERFQQFVGAVAVQADRVAADWQYSYLQQSNHAVSEGLGLYVTGLLFPQLKNAEEWKKNGKKILEERATFLFRADGTYFQKSHNYLRFIIHGYLYVMRVAEVNGESFSDTLKDRMRAALAYLKSVIDEQSGYVPNFGSNDGALILPVNSCDFRDFRPTIAVLQYYFHQNHCFEHGPWHEDLIWLFGPKSITQSTHEAIATTSRRFDESGIYTLRSDNSWGFTHAETFVDRPAHADALHLDLWWRGLNICCDPGTYLYYGHTPWLDAWKHTRFHNTIVVDGKDQMERAYRFTWGYWHEASLNAFQGEGPIRYLEAEHTGFHRLDDPVTHRRAIIAVADHWLVIDDLLPAEHPHEVELNWLLNDFPYQQQAEQLTLQTTEGDFSVGLYAFAQNGTLAAMPMDMLRAGEAPQETRGWMSNYYGHKAPAISLRSTYEGVLPQRFVSCFGASGWRIDSNTTGLTLTGSSQAEMKIALYPIGEDRIINIK